MRGWFAAALWLSGCNVVFGLDAPVATAVDAGDADAGDADAGVDAPLGDFREPARVVGTTDTVENDAVLTADGREVLYAAGPVGVPFDIVRADVTDGVWGQPRTLTELSTTGTMDGFLRFGRDDLTLYLSSDRVGGIGGADVYRATRDDRAAEWNTPVLVPELSSAGHDGTAAPCADETRFVLTSDRDGATALYEYDTTRAEQPIMFAVPLELPRSPFLTKDCLTLYVAGGAVGDLYELRRDALDTPWSAPRALSELNTTGASESDPWLSADGRHIVFSRDGDIWEAFR